jgi:outer membrane lipoprotein-sorting protein
MFVAGHAGAAEYELGWTLDSALKQIDRQAKDFQTMLADATAVTLGSDGKEVRNLTGRTYMTAKGNMRVSEDAPGNRVMLVDSREVQIYDPAQAIVDRYSLSKHKGRLEPYAFLGFTYTGRDLQDDYLVTMLGEDRLRGQRTLLLELTPKKDAERQIVGKVTLWIDEASWMPARQVIEHVSTGERLTIDYTGMARNLKLNPALFKANWPRGTKQIRR